MVLGILQVIYFVTNTNQYIDKNIIRDKIVHNVSLES